MFQDRLPRKYKFKRFEGWDLDVVFLDLDYIGYMQIDSTYIFIAKSAKSSVRKVKGQDKEFNIKERIYDLPFFVDPAIIVDIPK